MSPAEEDAMIEALAKHLGLDIALRDHRAELVAAARRAFAQRAALQFALAADAEPAPAHQRIGLGG